MLSIDRLQNRYRRCRADMTMPALTRLRVRSRFYREPEAALVTYFFDASWESRRSRSASGIAVGVPARRETRRVRTSRT